MSGAVRQCAHPQGCGLCDARVALRQAADALEGTLGVEGFPQNPYEFRQWLRERAREVERQLGPPSST